MSTPFTVSHPLGRVPTFGELQEKAKLYEVQIKGNDRAGEWMHSKAAGKYSFEKAGEISFDFSVPVPGLTGFSLLQAGKAEITITERPFYVPESLLKPKIMEHLKVFCDMFPPVA